MITLIVMNCIIFFIILVFIGLFIYIFRDYLLYKNNTENKLDKTSNYINDVIKDIDTNIIHYNNMLDNKYGGVTAKLSSNIIDKINDNSRIINNNIDIINSNIINTSNNIVNFDTNLGKYVKFDTLQPQNIDAKFYDYKFITENDLSLNLLRNVKAQNGLTVNTRDGLLDNNNLKICNKDDDPSCMFLNISTDKSFNITPNKQNIELLNFNKQSVNGDNNSIASFDLKNNKIYLGADDYSSPLVIDNNILYTKQIKLIKSDYISTNNKVAPTDPNIKTFNFEYIDTLNNNYNTLTNHLRDIDNTYNNNFEIIQANSNPNDDINLDTLVIKKNVRVCDSNKSSCIDLKLSDDKKIFNINSVGQSIIA